MRSTSVCASDLMYIGYGLKRILGHELAGVREDGTPVVVEALYGCMECELCLSGAYNLCPTHTQRALGATADGGMAEQFRAPSARLIPLPAGPRRSRRIDRRAGVGVVARAEPRPTGPDTRVAIVGAGALGLLAAAGARRMGADRRRPRGASPASARGRRAARRDDRHRRPVRRRDRGRRDRPRASPGRPNWWLPAARSSCSACTWARSS